MNNDLKKIKKRYGEDMMHYARKNFSTILENDGLLYDLFINNFYPSKYLYYDIKSSGKLDDFKNYIYYLYNKKVDTVETNKTPYELLKEAGYTLYECNNNEEVQSFKKYYEEDAMLCTFDEDRLSNCYVFFAVKDDALNIKRGKLSELERQDFYGTSVISIQFSRGEVNTLSIKNRYNHLVNNPDATFSNNLDTIISGLTYSFSKHYNFNINSNKNNLELDDYVKDSDGKYYRCNVLGYDKYCCSDNILIKDNKVITDYQDKSRYLIMDHLILDMQERKIIPVDFISKYDDIVNVVGNIEKIEVIRSRNSHTKKISIVNDRNEESIFVLDSHNSIIGFENKYVSSIGNSFLKCCKNVLKVNLPNVTDIGNDFMYYDKKLHSISIHKVRNIKNDFLREASELEEINLENVVNVGNSFIYNGINLKKVVMPNVQKIGMAFLNKNIHMRYISLPNVLSIDNGFMSSNQIIEELYMPRVVEVGSSFLEHDNLLEEVVLPKLEKAGLWFMANNNSVKKFIAPNLSITCNYFFLNNTCLEAFYAPRLVSLGSQSFYSNSKYNNEYRDIMNNRTNFR